MALILNIDTSTKICSVALSDQSEIIAYRENGEGRNHAALLTTFIEEVLQDAGIKPSGLDAISVSKGPGSYTGLRIGVSSAKGLAYGLSAPVIALPTLEIMAQGYSRDNMVKNDELLCPMIDARRMEVYTAFFTKDIVQCRETKAEIIEENSFLEQRKDHSLILFGDGADKCKEVLSGPEIRVDSNYQISATQMAELSYKAYKNKQFEDIAYFEPFYLKDFIATTPRKKVF